RIPRALLQMAFLRTLQVALRHSGPLGMTMLRTVLLRLTLLRATLLRTTLLQLTLRRATLLRTTLLRTTLLGRGCLWPPTIWLQSSRRCGRWPCLWRRQLALPRVLSRLRHPSQRRLLRVVGHGGERQQLASHAQVRVALGPRNRGYASACVIAQASAPHKGLP